MSEASTILKDAKTEAELAGSPTIEAEHLLLAMSSASGTPAQELLVSSGLDRETIVKALITELERSLFAAGIEWKGSELPKSSGVPGRDLRVGTSTKLALERAMRAKGGSRHLLGSLHMVIGVLEAKNGVVPRALLVARIDRSALIDRARRLLAGSKS